MVANLVTLPRSDINVLKSTVTFGTDLLSFYHFYFKVSSKYNDFDFNFVQLCFNVLKPSHDSVPLFCLLMQIQHCNEVRRNYMHLHKICLSYKNKYFSYYCFSSLIFTVLHTLIFIIIVKVKPGPDSVEKHY